MSGWRDFVPGEVLTAANVQDYLMDQSVMTFASEAARDAVLTSPTEGMIVYLADSNTVVRYEGSSWVAPWSIANGGTGATTLRDAQNSLNVAILQVKNGDLRDAFTTTSSSYVDTGIQVTITPKYSDSLILIIYDVAFNNGTSSSDRFVLDRNGTDIALNNFASPGQTFGTSSFAAVGNASMQKLAGSYLDMPGTTSPLTYKIQVSTTVGTLCINRRAQDTFYGAVSSITVMEVKV